MTTKTNKNKLQLLPCYHEEILNMKEIKLIIKQIQRQFRFLEYLSNKVTT